MVLSFLRPPGSVQVCIAADAVLTLVVVKAVVTVNLVTENFPLDTLQAKWATAVPVASEMIFQSVSRMLTVLTFHLGQIPRSKVLLSSISFSTSRR